MPSFVISQTSSPSHNPFDTSNTTMSSSGIFGSFAKKFSRKNSKTSNSNTSWRSTSWNSSQSPTSPTMRNSLRNSNAGIPKPAAPTIGDAPPAYSPVPESGNVPSTFLSGQDDRFAFLGKFDTLFLIDDSSSMAGENWRQTRDALAAITPVCTAYDTDGIDIHFLNAPDNSAYHNVVLPSTVYEIFSAVRPFGATPTGQRLHTILKKHCAEFAKKGESTKPLNIIVITDGEATDDVDSAIVAAAKKLDKMEAPPWQVGIQFFQVGRSITAREYLKYLDDNLRDQKGNDIRDMVDTVPWTDDNGGVLTPEGILKVALGAVNRRLDRSGVNLHQIGY